MYKVISIYYSNIFFYLLIILSRILKPQAVDLTLNLSHSTDEAILRIKENR